MIEQEDKL